MRVIIGLIMLSAPGGTGLQAQVEYNARLGLTWSTPMVRDVIIGEIEVRQKLAPTLVLGASLPIAPRYRAGLEATLTSSGYRARETGITEDLGSLRTGSLILAIQGPVVGSLRWRAGAGLLSYWPGDQRGIFLEGGTTRAIVGAGLDYRWPILQQWDMMFALGYDLHRFTTEELRDRGFSQSQGVQRISATLGMARGNR